MTTPSEPPHDPTMEEILASIRKIISEDQPGTIKSKGPDSVSGNGAGDILELTEEIPDEASGIPRNSAPGTTVPAPAAAQSGKRDPVLSDSSRQTIGRAFETLDRASQQYSSFAAGTLENAFSRAVLEAITPSLQAWVGSHEAPLLEAAKPLMRSWMDSNLPRLVETDLKQDLVEAAKPLLREWMDANLPQLVETVLKQELARAVTENLRSRLG